MDKYILQII